MRFALDGRTIQDRYPGIGRYTYELSLALAGAMEDDELILLEAEGAQNTRYPLSHLASLPHLTLVPSAVKTVSFGEQFRLPRLVKRLGADLLHSTYYVKPYRLPVPSVLTYYDVIGLVFPSALPSARARLAFRFASALALNTSDRVILLSRSAQEDVVELFRIPMDRTQVIYPGVPGGFAPQSVKAIKAFRERSGLPDRYVLYVGTNKPHKNLPFLVEAWGQARPDAQLVIAGQTDARYTEARQRVQQLELEDSVLFLGEVLETDLPLLYSGATLFAYPSLYEGFGLPVLEAMACGAAILCSDAASLPEVVGDAGVLLAPDDPQAWANALGELLTDAPRLQAMRQRSLRRAALFSWEQAARETLALYREVAS